MPNCRAFSFQYKHKKHCIKYLGIEFTEMTAFLNISQTGVEVQYTVCVHFLQFPLVQSHKCNYPVLKIFPVVHSTYFNHHGISIKISSSRTQTHLLTNLQVNLGHRTMTRN